MFIIIIKIIIICFNRLTYFKGRGRGESIRYILAEAGVEYEERIITKELLAELRSNGDLLFQQIPLLEIDGMKLIQSGSIVRYLARKYNLEGRTDKEIIDSDMLFEGLRDFLAKFLGYVFQPDKESYIQKVIPMVSRYLSPSENFLKTNNGGKSTGFILGDHISYVDLILLEILEYINEIIPAQLEGYPLLKAFRVRMLERPSMKEFYEKGLHYPLPGDDYAQNVAQVLDWK